MTEAFKREKYLLSTRLYHVQHPIILELINSRELQRLRDQANRASMYTFHTAEHSRFSHSLGVYEIARHLRQLCA